MTDSTSTRRRSTWTHLVAASLCLVMVFPVLWAVTTSLKPADEVFSVDLFPHAPTLANYREALDTFPLAALLVNTALMAAGVTAGQLLLSVLAAYAFTRFTFRGQRLAFVAAVGTPPARAPSSAGMRLIAGLDRVDGGQVRIGDRDVTAAPARERGIAMVFQDFALYPHMTVEGNVAFGLRLEAKHDRRHGPSRQEIAGRVSDVLDLVDLEGLGERRPSQLSGGQRQRVALARAIVRQPAVFLMDEPLSNLDAQLRAKTRAELIRLHRRLDTTVVYVTHDQVEAMTMATRLAVMDQGAIVQVGPPAEVYRSPATAFVARFMGSPPMNLCHADARCVGTATQLSGHDLAGGLATTGLPTSLDVGWRPSHAQLVDEHAGPLREPGGLRMVGTVEVHELLGDDVLLSVEGPWGQAGVLQPADAPRPDTSQRVTISVLEHHLHLFHPESGMRIAHGPPERPRPTEVGAAGTEPATRNS